MKNKSDNDRKSKATVRVSRDALTKSFLERAARKGIQKATETTTKVMGFNVIARDGWIVKLFPDNSIERISQIPGVIETR